jgi:predicted nucleotidyltransferase component of viral defense system
MISEESISIEWIEQVSANNNKADKILVEKVVRALSLLESLVISGCPFIFKGGTALMLHLNSSKRLSIDIDIISPTYIDFTPFFQMVIENSNFIRYELNERSSDMNIPKAHVKFFYEPTYITSQQEEYILLDILFEKAQYAKLIELNIDSPFIKQDGKLLSVNVPSIEDMLGDKLTAFAPNTTGIPYIKNGNSKTMEIIKQLYDIASLFDRITDATITTTTFKKFAQTEQGYRNQTIDHKQVLNDIFQTALCISTRGSDGNGDFDALMRGITQVRSFVFSENYQIDKATVAASKAAYISTLIGSEATTIIRFQNQNQVTDWVIEQPFNTKLNKLRKSIPEAFFYWYQTYLLIKFR